MIELVNLGKTYNNSAEPVVAIENINLKIEDGDIFGIIGLSGAGKSTLVRCINFLEVPTEGKVLFNGTDLSKLSKSRLRDVRKKITMIFQHFNLLEQRTVLGNVCYPMEISGIPRAKAKNKALELLRLVGLEDKTKTYPSKLSGGQKQRVAIARALATDPEVLLCDEATSALDPTTTRQILELLQKINRELKVTIIVITHEMKVIEQICNKVAVLDKSHIVEVGSMKDIFMAPKSKIAKQLILPNADHASEDIGIPEGCGKDSRYIRLVFSGESAYEPIISKMIVECGTTVNVIGANIKTFEGKTYGQMLVGLENDEEKLEKVRSYLSLSGITFEEVSENG